MFHNRRRLGAVRVPFVAAGGADSAELSQFLARITAPSAPRKALYAALIDGLVADGVWTKIDGLYVMAAADAATARTNLKQSSYGLTANGGMTFTTDQGYTGDGSSGYMATGYDPSIAGGNFPSTGNTGCLASYIQTSDTGGGFNHDIHCAGNTSFIVPLFAGGTYTQIGGAGATGITNPTGNTRGSYLISRTASNAFQSYRNAATYGSPMTGATVGGSSGDMTLFASGGGGSAFSNRQNSAGMFGGSLTGAQAIAYQNRINNYMANLPTPINVH